MIRFYYFIRASLLMLAAVVPVTVMGTSALLDPSYDWYAENRIANIVSTLVLCTLPLCALFVREFARFVSPPEKRPDAVVFVGAVQGTLDESVVAVLRGLPALALLMGAQVASVNASPIVGVPLMFMGWLFGFAATRTTYLRSRATLLCEGWIIPSWKPLSMLPFVSVRKTTFVRAGSRSSDYEPVAMHPAGQIVSLGEPQGSVAQAEYVAQCAAAVLGRPFVQNPHVASDRTFERNYARSYAR